MEVPEILKKLEADWKPEYFKNLNGEAFITLEKSGADLTFDVTSGKFENFLRGHAYKNYEIVLSDSKTEKLLTIIRSKSLFEDMQKEVAVRCGWSQDRQTIYHDLGDQYVQIDRYGWSIVKKAPIPFVRYGFLGKQVKPEKIGDLTDVLPFFNLSSEDDKLLLLVFIVSCFIPDIPHPVLAIHGIQGSAKTTALRFLLSLVDPSPVADTQTLSMQDFLQTVSHRWVTPLDNQTNLSTDYSDLLCKVVTGTGFAKRMLYTNNDDFIQHIQRIVILNGISLPISKSDILDRCLILELERIKDCDRRDEADLKNEFEQLKPKILGACFHILSLAISHKSEIRLCQKPRLADFAIWGCAIAKALGLPQEKFIDAFNLNVKRQHQEAIAASPLADAVYSFMIERKDEYNSTMTEALNDITRHAINRGQNYRSLPQSTRSFGKKIKELTTNLQSVHLIVERKRTTTRNIRIFWENGAPS
tara:strand:- start:1449 stop:2867 length:1419 start_codon:yes stop_codon:yes gene_type:complete